MTFLASSSCFLLCLSDEVHFVGGASGGFACCKAYLDMIVRMPLCRDYVFFLDDSSWICCLCRCCVFLVSRRTTRVCQDTHTTHAVCQDTQTGYPQIKWFVCRFRYGCMCLLCGIDSRPRMFRALIQARKKSLDL